MWSQRNEFWLLERLGRKKGTITAAENITLQRGR